DRGHDLLLIDLPRFGPVDPEGLLGPTTEVAFADLLDIGEWEQRLEGADVVVHSAAIHQVDELRENPIRALEVNVGATRHLLEACERVGARRFVYLSSAKVYGKVDHASIETDLVMPIEPYGLAKVVGEGYCEHFRKKGSLETISLRPFSVYGPRQPVNTGYIGALIATLQANNRLVLPGQPTFSRDFVHVDTVVEVVVAAIEADGELPPLLNIGSGQPTSLPELVDLFEAITERSLDVTFVDPRPGSLHATLSEPTLMNDFASPRAIELSAGLEQTITAHIERS
ncbi:MAG: NAD-dependent epimerase/dehydratase family protein, partial [Acidobacteria bacterium]|nr:NAD-dependent epimerase/dehydratase family protein [Acidobacteriota bacterium]